MGLGGWLAQKAGLAGQDIVGLPGAFMHTAEATDPATILAQLLSGQEGVGGAFNRYKNATEGLIGGTYGTVRHPLRDPFQTALLLAPFAKGLRFGAAAPRTFEEVSGFKTPAAMIRSQIERDNPGAFSNDGMPNRVSKGPADLVKHFTEPPRNAREVFNRMAPKPPHNTEDVIQGIADKLGIHRSEVERQMRAADMHRHNITNDVIGNIARKRGGSLEQRVNAHFNAQPARGIHFSEGGHKLANTSFHESPEFAFKKAAHGLEDPRHVLLRQLMQRHYEASSRFHHPN